MKLALRSIMLVLTTTMSSACSVTRDTIYFASADSSSVRLLESSTARPIPRADVKLRIYFEIPCKKWYCAPDSTMWTGRSDSSGRVMIPKRVIKMQPTTTVDGYVDDPLENATLSRHGEWVLELTRLDSTGSGPVALKLLDRESKEPFVNERVILTFSDTHGGKHDVSLTTNPFGFIFVQPQIAEIGNHTSLKIQHYHVEFVFFSSPQRNVYFTKTSGRFDYDR